MRPIRVYAALHAAATVSERIDLVVRELERQGAFRRQYLLVAIPTGGGHVNPVVPEALERMTGGDVASCAVQFGTLPSFLSITKVGDGARIHAALLARIAQRVKTLYPHGGGPRVLLYGESLGAWSGAQILSGGGPQRLRQLGIDRVLWVGEPGFATFDTSGFPFGAIKTHESWEAVLRTSADRHIQQHLRVMRYSHPDDPVHRADLATILRPSRRSTDDDIAAVQRPAWIPVLTFARSVFDLIVHANQARPGEFTDDTHDYRLELARLVRDGFGVQGVSDARLGAIAQQLERSDAWVLNSHW